jgi:TrmH family RNA methyltransferase
MAFEKITSLKNEGIKNLVALRDRKARDEQGLTLIDGVREISTALEAGVRFEKLYLCADLLEAKDFKRLTQLCKVEILETTQAVFEKIAFGDRAEGAIGVVRPVIRRVDDLKLPKNPFVVVVEKVEKPGNLGAILRSCDAAGVDAVIVCDAKTDLYNPNVIRSSLGAIFTVMIACGSNGQAQSFLHENKINAVGTFPDATMPYSDYDFKSPSAIILGSEQDGLSAFWHEHSQVKITLPMRGRVNSLNVSATAAIVIYEAIRQRR